MESFIFYQSFWNAIECLPEANQLHAYQYITRYALHGTNPDPEEDAVAYAIFVMAKPQIDANIDRRKNGGKWGRPPKENPTVSENAENQKPMVIENEKIKKPMVSKKEENKKPLVIKNAENEKPNVNVNVNVNDNVNNVISLTWDKADAKKYGDPEINDCMDLIKKYNGGVSNGSDAKQRRYAKNLIDKLKKFEKVEKWEYTRQQVLEVILEIIGNDKYYAPKIWSPQLIYENLSSLLQACKQNFGNKSVWKQLKTV